MILKVHIESVVLVRHESFVSTLNPIYEHRVAQQRTNKCVNNYNTLDELSLDCYKNK